MPKHKWEKSLTELTKLKITDIYGIFTTEFGDPVFELTRVELEDGSVLHVEGEHDLPYFTDEKNLIPIPEGGSDNGDD